MTKRLPSPFARELLDEMLPEIRQAIRQELAAKETSRHTLSATKAARYLRIGDARFLALVKAGEIPFVDWDGGRRYFSQTALDEFMDRRAAVAPTRSPSNGVASYDPFQD